MDDRTTSRFLRACRREPVDRTPVWLMRQAGRYMPEYRAVRERHGFLQMVKTPEVACEITMQPLRAFQLDAAIIFADILPPLEGMGLELTYAQGEGPTIHNPIRSAADVERLRVPDPRETVAYTLEAIRLTRRELAGKTPLIGFSGAPFTLASYAIEGGSSRDFRRTKQLMYAAPDVWHTLMTKLSDLVAAYLLAQIAAGADAVQLFDSWVGCLSPDDYAQFVLPYTQRVVAQVRQGDRGTGRHGDVQIAHNPPGLTASQSHALAPPIIYFGTETSGLFHHIRQLGTDVVGVDWRIALDDAWAQLGPGVAVQGNLDPMLLFAPWETLRHRADDILARAAGRPGHIFNLGHGILTETPVDNVRRLVEHVHAATDHTVS